MMRTYSPSPSVRASSVPLYQRRYFPTLGQGFGSELFDIAPLFEDGHGDHGGGGWDWGYYDPFAFEFGGGAGEFFGWGEPSFPGGIWSGGSFAPPPPEPPVLIMPDYPPWQTPDGGWVTSSLPPPPPYDLPTLTMPEFPPGQPWVDLEAPTMLDQFDYDLMNEMDRRGLITNQDWVNVLNGKISAADLFSQVGWTEPPGGWPTEQQSREQPQRGAPSGGAGGPSGGGAGGGRQQPPQRPQQYPPRPPGRVSAGIPLPGGGKLTAQIPLPSATDLGPGPSPRVSTRPRDMRSFWDRELIPGLPNKYLAAGVAIALAPSILSSEARKGKR